MESVSDSLVAMATVLVIKGRGVGVVAVRRGGCKG